VKAFIEQRARELGFDACRVTSADSPATAPQFERWLAAGQHGEMTYLARNAAKRVEPDLVLPNAKSIVTLAVAYSGEGGKNEPGNPPCVSLAECSDSPEAPADRQRHAGLVARYARYKDYHNVLIGPLKQLADFIDQLGGAATRSLWYVDTGPLLERDLAQRAGIGFIGKHTNLINRRLGNWFFLGEILTTLELEPDAPEKNRCGSCVRCIDACPTRAIIGPFQLDARRCISYLTIELKGSIPVDLRPALGNRIYGCDDCLEACPWNRFAREGRMMKEHERPDLEAPDLIDLLALSEAGFKTRFAGTPLLRTKRRGLLRNVCVALGNVGDCSALPALERAASDAEPLVAEHARWAMEQIESRTRANLAV